jgi:excisionase family DNA binding protein
MQHVSSEASADVVLTSEAARIIGVSAQSVRQYERSGRLPAVRTGTGVRLFKRADCEQLRQARENARRESRSAA